MSPLLLARSYPNLGKKNLPHSSITPLVHGVRIPDPDPVLAIVPLLVP